jgi:hypothetical protein
MYLKLFELQKLLVFESNTTVKAECKNYFRNF